MLKVLQYNLNNRKRQKAIKLANVYISKSKLEMLKRKIAHKHRIDIVHIYMTTRELMPEQIQAIKKSSKFEKNKYYEKTKKSMEKNSLFL